MNNEYPELHDFLGAYFHQDWTVEYETADQVIDAYLNEAASEDLLMVRRELNGLLGQGKTEMVLREYLLTQLSCYYCYWNDWVSGESWLGHIANRLAHQCDRQC